MGTRLAGKKALVTAAGQGIGRAVAETFAREGAQVLATDINAKALAGLDGTPGVTTRLLDVTDAAAIDALAAEVGAVQVLFNGAGFVHAGSVLECSEADWDFAFTLNVRSMYRLIRACLPAMLKHHEQGHGGASIINVSSAASSIKGVPNRFVYATSKAAVIGLTKSMAAELGPDRIRVNAVMPGLVAGDRQRRRLANVVGPRREGEAEEPDGRTLQRGDRADLAHDAIELLVVDRNDTPHQREVVAGVLRDRNDGAAVLR